LERSRGTAPVKEFNVSTSVIIFPGIGNSGPQHWQTYWEQANPDFARVQQRDWDNPNCEEWAAALETAVKRAGSERLVVVAHSLACLVVAHWAARPHTPIKAALLVAVPNPNGPNFPKEAIGFSVTPEQKFSFPSMVVASSNDPYGTLEHTAHLASAWGSEFVNIGDHGHINASSGLGAWDKGYEYLTQLLRR
jgi:predicted alpha/beta hydrolase family esterase